MKETKCEYCGKMLKEDEVQTFQGVIMCKDCLEEKTVVCSWCVGKCKSTKFALAHNGILFNDKELRKTMHQQRRYYIKPWLIRSYSKR